MAKRTSLKTMGDSIANKEKFQGSNIQGGDRSGSFGQLPREHQDAFVEHNPNYVVHSYSTPIAWHSDTHGWHVPDVKYSQTTSRQQGVVRRALKGHFTTAHDASKDQELWNS
jgi:hypothetical protein